MRAGVWCTGSLSTGVNRPLCDGAHLPPYPAQSKKWWSYVSIPPVYHAGLYANSFSIKAVSNCNGSDLLFGRAESPVFQFAIQNFQD